MRIGLIIYGSLDTESGGYLYDRIVTEGLVRLGHEVEVISLPGGSYLRRLGSGLSTGLCRRLSAGGFDVLVQDELCHPSLFLVNQWLRLVRRERRPILVALIHHVLCREPRRRWQNRVLAVVERRFLASVDGYIHNSETTRQTVAELVGGNRPEVVANPAGDRFGNPLSPEIIGKRAFRPGPLELLFLGNVIPRKGLLPLLGALAKVDRDLWRLSVVGSLDFDPGHVAEARQVVNRLGLADSVRFQGFCRDEQLIEVLSTSHLFCMPYAYEGFGIAILEAMAFGLPAIGSRAGAAGETISHGTNGFLLDSGDLDGLAPLLADLHRDREELRRMSFAACHTYAGRPTWRESAATVDGFLREIMDMQSRSITGNDFSASYLAAKKTIDDRSLNRHVWETLRHALSQAAGDEPVKIIEIGAGIGTMLTRVMDWGLLTGPATYVVTDPVEAHFPEARRYLSRWAEQSGHQLSWQDHRHGRLRTISAEVELVFVVAGAEELAENSDNLGPFHLLIAHAVLDLIDFPVLLPRLLARLEIRGLAYLTCNFDGETVFLPECEGEEEKEILSRYHGSMEARLSGASRTGRRLLSFLQGPGLELLAAGSSDWLVYPRNGQYPDGEAFFLQAIIATVEQELGYKNENGSSPPGLSAWAGLRNRQVKRGELSLLARHLDFLARRQSPP